MLYARHLNCLSVPALAIFVFPALAAVPKDLGEAVKQPHEVDYWDTLYAQSAQAGVKTFGSAWQSVDLAALRDVTKLNLGPQDRVLVLGAGDSGLSEELFDAGCRNVTAVDFSPRLVQAMAELSHGVLWRMEDARKLSFAEETFDVVLDVALLDSVASGGDDKVAAALAETYRVLNPGGTYISVSTEPPHYRLPLFARVQIIGEGGWDTKVLFLPRARSLDPRVRRIDHTLDMDKLSVYVSVKPGGIVASETLAVEAQATITVVKNGSGTGVDEASEQLEAPPLSDASGTVASEPEVESSSTQEVKGKEVDMATAA